MADKPKILHTMTWLAEGGGVDKNVLLTIAGLKDKYDFHLAVGREIYSKEFDQIKEIKLHICKDLLRSINPIKDINALIYFIRLLRNEKFDIIHTHETKASLITRTAAYLTGCKCIIYGLHGVTFNDPMSNLKRQLYILIEKYTIWMCNRIIAVSNDVINNYHQNKIGTNIPFEIIYSGIDINEFKYDVYDCNVKKQQIKDYIGLTRDAQIIINVGRFSTSKAQRYTIDAFAKIKNEMPETKLILVGVGEMLEECKLLTQKYNLENDVIFYGYSDDVASLLSVADVFMFTSLREGLPRVVVEASLMKVPTAAYEVEGIHEIIKDGYSGFIVPKYDNDLLAARTVELLKDASLRRLFGDRSYANAINNWDANIMIQSLDNVYKKST